MLNPTRQPQPLTWREWNEHTPPENKLELIDGEALYGGRTRLRLLLALLYNTGWNALLSELPANSIEELRLALESLAN
ncbi:MAG: hypothetical protein ACYCYO_00365 [Bacilli bacterium]